MSKEKVTVAEAARRMGKSPMFVREAMKRGILPIGTVMKMPGSTKWTFHISPGKLEAYLKGEERSVERGNGMYQGC